MATIDQIAAVRAKMADSALERAYRDPEFLEVLARSAHSLENFCNVFLHERFTRPFSRSHHEFFEVADDRTVKKVLVIAHRGWGKTSIFNYALPAQHIAFQSSRCIVPVSASNSAALLQSENLKRALLQSDEIRAAIGGEIKSDTFSRDIWITASDVMVYPRGQGQQIRGILHSNWRPDLLIADDLEDPEEVRSEEQRRKTKEWFFTDFMNCVDRSGHWRIVVVGTILNAAGGTTILQDLKDDPSWTCLEFPLCDEEYKSYWPFFMNDEEVSDLVQDYKRQGRLDDFYREYMNQPMSGEDAPFKPEYFKHYRECDMDFSPSQYESFVVIDPTKSDRPSSAYSAIVGVTFDNLRNLYYIRDIINDRLVTEDLYSAALDMAHRLGAKAIGLEVTGLSEFITKPFADFMLKRGTVYELVELNARKGQGEFSGRTKGKAGRVAALSPYYRMGHIFHNETCCDSLETQLLQWPSPRHWDVADATAYIIEMTDKGERFFTSEKIDDRGDEAAFATLREEDLDPKPEWAYEGGGMAWPSINSL